MTTDPSIADAISALARALTTNGAATPRGTVPGLGELLAAALAGDRGDLGLPHPLGDSIMYAAATIADGLTAVAGSISDLTIALDRNPPTTTDEAS